MAELEPACAYALEELELGNQWSAMTNTFECLITSSDRSMFDRMTFLGTVSETVWNAQTGAKHLEWHHRFRARHFDGPATEVQVDATYPQQEASELATYYMTAIGRLPLFLRASIPFLLIRHPEPDGIYIAFSAGSDHIRIYHTDFHIEFADDVNEETLMHEAAHILLWDFGYTPEWQAARYADGTAVTAYAEFSYEGFSDAAQEDPPESLLAYLAVRHCRERIGERVARAIEELIPNRLALLDAQDWDGQWCPIVEEDCP